MQVIQFNLQNFYILSARSDKFEVFNTDYFGFAYSLWKLMKT